MNFTVKVRDRWYIDSPKGVHIRAALEASIPGQWRDDLDFVLMFRKYTKAEKRPGDGATVAVSEAEFLFPEKASYVHARMGKDWDLVAVYHS
jgi:hypothetical protein